jgi:hypothetical protein
MSVRVTGAPVGGATLQWLSAPGVRARTGVSLAEQSFGSSTLTGALPGNPLTIALTPERGRYAVTLPATTAAMIVVPAPS